MLGADAARPLKTLADEGLIPGGRVVGQMREEIQLE